MNWARWTNWTKLGEASASTIIALPPETVWAHLEDPALGFMDTGIVGAFRVPGTPQGAVGAQQAFIQEVGNGMLRVSLAEIIALEPGRWVTVEYRTIWSRAHYDLTPDAGATRLTYTQQFGFRWWKSRRRVQRRAVAEARVSTAGMKQFMESKAIGEQPQTATGARSASDVVDGDVDFRE